MSPELSQEEADVLIALEKIRVSDELHSFPLGGAQVVIDLISNDRSEKFVLTIRTGRKKLSQVSFQNLARRSITLVRVDLDGPPHTNPDKELIECPHIHLYREGFGDKWAFPIDSKHFRDISDVRTTLEDFFVFCNITAPPHFKTDLFTSEDENG